LIIPLFPSVSGGGTEKVKISLLEESAANIESLLTIFAMLALLAACGGRYASIPDGKL